MRSWHQGNIWSQNWVTVRADTACEDSFMPTVALHLCRLTAVECRHLPWLNLEWLPVYQQWACSVSWEFQIIITPGLLSETGGSFRCCIQASCWECCWEQVYCETHPTTWYLWLNPYDCFKPTPSLSPSLLLTQILRVLAFSPIVYFNWKRRNEDGEREMKKWRVKRGIGTEGGMENQAGLWVACIPGQK